ncbi:MAG: hypothetical protein AVDCRST_MAG93-1809 [uncultured Chloroflexia bacterium]|uniref:Uncharacterized protein n=1 Tax=uncultured Chloroflexia bacterium TaxID=1672391 RepID=A0A6J4IJK6_9CHLR|nr:MAG: hypothetical protein AVDCRST_MAG93-1809 [uncultured Chloroflexia bacterium]
MGLQTDVRASFLGAKLNPMLQVPLDHLVEREAALLSLLSDLLSHRLKDDKGAAIRCIINGSAPYAVVGPESCTRSDKQSGVNKRRKYRYAV